MCMHACVHERVRCKGPEHHACYTTKTHICTSMDCKLNRNTTTAHQPQLYIDNNHGITWVWFMVQDEGDGAHSSLNVLASRNLGPPGRNIQPPALQLSDGGWAVACIAQFLLLHLHSMQQPEVSGAACGRPQALLIHMFNTFGAHLVSPSPCCIAHRVFGDQSHVYLNFDCKAAGTDPYSSSDQAASTPSAACALSRYLPNCQHHESLQLLFIASTATEA